MAGVKDFVNTVQKKFGKEVIAGDNRAGVEFLPSGSLSLDLALGGGYAKGRIIELMGYESCGKTTLALHACLSAQNEGKAVLYVDRENAIDIDYVEALGIDTDPEKFILTQPGVAEECFEIIREAIKTDEIGVIVLDKKASQIKQMEFNNSFCNLFHPYVVYYRKKQNKNINFSLCFLFLFLGEMEKPDCFCNWAFLLRNNKKLCC